MSNFCCSRVRLLVHKLTFSIFALNVNVVDEIFFQTLFVWQENDLVFSSIFEKINLKTIT